MKTFSETEFIDFLQWPYTSGNSQVVSREKINNSIEHFETISLTVCPFINYPVISSPDKPWINYFPELIRAYKKYVIQKILVLPTTNDQIVELLVVLQKNQSPLMEILIDIENLPPAAAAWDLIIEFITAPSLIKKLGVKINKSLYSAKSIKKLSQALARAPSITSFGLSCNSCQLLEISEERGTREVFVECAKIVKQNVFLKSFAINSRIQRIDLCLPGLPNPFTLERNRIREQLKTISLPSHDLISVSAPTGQLDSGSLSRGVALWFKSDTVPTKKQSLAKPPQMVIISDPLFLLQRPLTDEETSFYEQVASTYTANSWGVLTEDGLKQFNSLKELLLNRPIKKMKCLPPNQFPYSVLPETVAAHSVKIIDATLRQEIISNSLSINSIHLNLTDFLDKPPHYVDDQFETYLAALNYQVEQIEIKLDKIDTNHLKALLKGLSLCSNIRTLALKVNKHEHRQEIWAEETMLDFNFKRSLPCLESLSIEEPPPELFKKLLQETFNLHVNYYSNPFNGALSLDEIKKEEPSTLSIEIIEQDLIDAKFDGLFKFANPAIVLKTLYFTRCRLSLSLIESINRFLKTFPSQTINIILKDSPVFLNHIDYNNFNRNFLTGGASLLVVKEANYVNNIETFGEFSFLHDEKLSVSVPTNPTLKNFSGEIKLVPNAISKSTQSHHIEKPADSKEKRRLKQPIMGKELAKEQASHFARVHVFQDIQLNQSTSTWEMFNDLQQDDIKELKVDPSWMQPETVSTLYHQNLCAYYGEFDAILQPGERYPLPSYLSSAHLQGASISGCNPDKIKKELDNDTGQILIGLQPNIKLPHRVKITFTSVPAPLSISLASKARCLRLPSNLHKWLKNAEQKIKSSTQQQIPLSPALDPFVTLIRQVNDAKDDSYKLSLIRAYCHENQAKTKTVNFVQNIEDFITQCLPADIELSEQLALRNTCNIMLQQVQNCGLQVFSAVILCRFFGIPARMITNAQHGLLEAPQFSNEGPLVWQTYELGGVAPDCEYEIEELSAPIVTSVENKHAAKEKKQNISDLKINDSKSNPLTRTSFNELRHDYDADQSAHPPIQELSELKQKIADNGDPIRIVLPTEDAMYSLARSLRREEQPLFIIRELTELVAAQTPALNGKAPAPKSLAHCLQHNTAATLVINASGFKPRDLPCLNNLLDQSKRNKQLKIILLHLPTQEIEATLAARTMPIKFQANENFLEASQAVLPHATAAELKSYQLIPCPQDPQSAQVKLFGQLSCDQKGWQQKTRGTIYETLINTEQKQARVIKLPKEPSLRHGISKILVEGHYTDAFHQMTPLPPDFVLYQDHSDDPTIFEEKQVPLQLLSRIPEPHKGRIFYLNASTVSDFTNLCQIDENGIRYGDDLLSQYQAGDIIRITGNISADQFQELIDFMKAHAEKNPVIPLCFYTEPGIILPQGFDFKKVKLPDIEVKETKNQEPGYKSIIQTCSQDEYDAEYQRDVKAERFCCTVSPQTTYDLLNVIRLTGSGVETKLEAKTSAIIQALRAGQEVVLYGELSSEMIESIQSLLGNPPYLKNEIFKKARLRWVKPPLEEESLLLQRPINSDWTAANATLSQALDDSKQNQFLCITGPTGSGKTHAIESHARENKLILYRGHEIKTWLQQGGTLYLDEANRSPDGAWDLLRDVVLQMQLRLQGIDQGKVAYLDEVYELTANHRVIVSQNPNHYPGCQEHAVFECYFQHLSMPEMSDEVMKEIILKEQGRHLELACKLLFATRHLIKRLMPDYPFTLRDCFAILNSAGDLNKPLAIAQACVAELGFIFPDRATQTTFIQQMATIAQVSPAQLLPLSESDLIYLDALRKQNFYVPKSREFLTAQLAHLLHDYSNGKRAIILEGPLGVGKTELCCQLLKYFKIDYVEIDPSISIGQGTAAFEAKLLDAFDKGQAVVIDEFNLLEESQLSLLLQLLEGRHPSGRSALKPGFRLIATQNPANFEGRNAASAALINRAKRLQVFDYDVQELQILAENKLKFASAISTQANDYSENKNHARCIALVFNELRNYCKTQQKTLPNYRFFFQLCEQPGIKTLSPGAILSFLVDASGLSLSQQQIDDVLKQIFTTINTKENFKVNSLQNLFDLASNNPELLAKLRAIEFEQNETKEPTSMPAPNLFNEFLEILVANRGYLPEAIHISKNSNLMSQILGQNREDISKHLHQIKHYQKTQPELYFALLYALTKNYRRIRRNESTTIEKGIYVPYFGRGRTTREKKLAALALSKFIKTANSLLHSDAKLSASKSSADQDEIKQLEVLANHQDAFKSGQLGALYLAFTSAIRFNKKQLSQELQAMNEHSSKTLLLPLIAKYMVNRCVKGAEYTSSSGRFNPWAYSEQQKKSASQVMWNFASGKITRTQLQDELRDKKLTPAAQNGALGLIYRKLENHR